MPTRAMHPCGNGCPTLVSEGRCATHRRAIEQQRGSASSRGYGKAHRVWRAVILARDPLCVACKAKGRVEPSTVADHIKPIEQGGAQFDEANGCGLCQTCHNVKRSAESRGHRGVILTGRGMVEVA